MVTWQKPVESKLNDRSSIDNDQNQFVTLSVENIENLCKIEKNRKILSPDFEVDYRDDFQRILSIIYNISRNR